MTCFRPAGLRECPPAGIGRGLAAYLAEAAHLEAASAIAFGQMTETLRRFGAPEALIRDAEAAQQDELRHAKTMSRLSRGYGVAPKAVAIGEYTAHSLESLAVENAVEGCVRETYAVVRALWQAEHARDPRVRAALRVIAGDETRHAELSWDLAAWLDSQLDDGGRARVHAARAAAMAELRHELGGEPHEEVVVAAGMPRAAEAVRLFDEMIAQLGLAQGIAA